MLLFVSILCPHSGLSEVKVIKIILFRVTNVQQKCTKNRFLTVKKIKEIKSQKQLFLGHEVYLEDAVEIVAKKMYYRGSAAMARDIFDLAVVYSDRPKDIIDTFGKFPEKTRNFYKAFHNLTMEGNALYSTAQAKSILLNGLKYTGKEMEICMSLEKDLIYKKCIH